MGIFFKEVFPTFKGIKENKEKYDGCFYFVWDKTLQMSVNLSRVKGRIIYYIKIFKIWPNYVS